MMYNGHLPTQGSLLIAEPFVIDPIFERSVILLCEHHAEASIGLILNNKSHLILSDIFTKIKDSSFPIYIGGPVEESALFFLHRTFEKIQSGVHIYDDIYWGGDFDYAVELINDGILLPNEIKFFLGYSGWSPKQLSNELDLNSWAVHTSYDTSLAFIHDGEYLWKQSLISLGPKYAHVANFPKTPFLN